MNTSDFIDLSRRLRSALTPADLDETLANITAAAVEVLPDVQYSSITISHSDGRLETAAPTHDFLLDLDAAQYDLREGPCYDAATDTVHASAPHLATDTRWPRCGPVAVAAGIQAQAGIRLFDSEQSNGALNLYAEKAGAFENLDSLGELFSHHAAVAFAFLMRVSNTSNTKLRSVAEQVVGEHNSKIRTD